MRRAKREDEDGGLDSLLDTMTNVVGILVIVLVVTQLGVGDAVQRIVDSIQIDAQELAEAERKLAQQKLERDRLLAAMDEQQPTDDADVDQRLQEKLRQIEQQQKVVEQLQQQQKAQEDLIAERTSQEAKVKDREKEIKEANRQLGTLSSESRSLEDKIQEQEALLDQTPERQVMPPREIFLPDPRPAPEGAQQLIFVCSKNKVYPLPTGTVIEQIRKLAQARAVMVAKKQYRTFKPAENGGIDRFLDEFNQRPWRDEYGYFETRLANHGGSPRLAFLPRESGGETEKTVLAPRSRFRQALETIDGTKYFIRFYVCADSFDIYVTTRRIVSDMGLLAGWEPQSVNWNYSTHLGGDLRFGPPPKPTPKPKIPAAPAPKKPANVID